MSFFFLKLDNYLQLKGTQLEREMAAEIILHILDKVMQNTQSLNSQQVNTNYFYITFYFFTAFLICYQKTENLSIVKYKFKILRQKAK